MDPHRKVRVPTGKGDGEPIAIDALWTDKGLRPTATNLAFFVQYVPKLEEVRQYQKQLQELPVRGHLIATDERYYLQYYDRRDRREEVEIEPENLASELSSPKSDLFSPKALSKFRTGQVSLADLEASLSVRSFSFLMRQREMLDKAFQSAIQSALDRLPKKLKNRSVVEGYIIRVAIAYLAARILEDKGFFPKSSTDPFATNDPRQLLDRTVSRLNGFFQKSKHSIPRMEEFLPRDAIEVILQHLAVHLGDRVTFALVNHKDVGLLYEKAVRELPKLDGKDWGDLQQHYTPVAIAERILELLPLERIRPEERIIFDPAAGSGSLLLAATSRLAGMEDLPENPDERNNYLANHVVGNDLDENARLVAELRYTLARESLSQDAILPFPNKFDSQDYNHLNRGNLYFKPRVVIANPPFAKRGDKQIAAKFVEQALNWLEDDSQFAFVLPQSILSGTSHGFLKARQLMSNRCQILEVLQFPEKTVGIKAKQAVAIVLGIVGKPKMTVSVMSRAVFSQNQEAVSNVQKNGFTGTSWIAKIKSDDWSSVTAPPILLEVPVVLLGQLFYVFAGVTLGKITDWNQPLKDCPVNVKCKRYWQMQWHDRNKLWADPNRVPEDKRWLRYGKKYLKRPCFKNEHLFDVPKLLVGNAGNRSSESPLSCQIDTIGLCPNHHVFCILPVKEAEKCVTGYENSDIPTQFAEFTYGDQKLWLLGILTSKLGNDLSMIGRKSRELTRQALCDLPLPLKIDRQIIDVTRQIVERDFRHDPIPSPDPLRERLEALVNESYGNPQWIEISRTGTPPELKAWKHERTKPTWTVSGQVLDISKEGDKIFLYLNGLVDENREKWMPILPELPGWALDGTVFKAQLSQDVETFEELSKRPWALRDFRHTPYPYSTYEELEEKLMKLDPRKSNYDL